MHAGGHKFVFLVKSPIVLVAVAHTQESDSQVTHSMYMYLSSYCPVNFLTCYFIAIDTVEYGISASS
jgi:hypothetical protein